MRYRANRSGVIDEGRGEGIRDMGMDGAKGALVRDGGEGGWGVWVRERRGRAARVKDGRKRGRGMGE